MARALALTGLALLAGLLALPTLAVGAGVDGASESTPGATAIPPRVLAAYQANGDACEGLRWELLAGIGWVESHHGTLGRAAVHPETGDVTPWILGLPLDGTGGREAHPLGAYAGRWGLSGAWERAVGPMQFRAPTFEAWGLDGDGDGVIDPHDVDDAVASAASYLCGAAGEVTDERRALARYNAGSAYAGEVLAYAEGLALPGLVGADGWVCPVAGPTSFADTWGAPRSGGRTHRGVDMFAEAGTPVVTPVAGNLEHFHDGLGGRSFRLWGTDGNYYFGTHLSGYGALSGEVEAGVVAGYVGASGNASGTSPHLHFEIHPGRRPGSPRAPVNPTPTVAVACAENRFGAELVGGS